MSDAWEVAYNLDPEHHNATLDGDGDGLDTPVN